MTSVLVVTGLSGAGRSVSAGALEDLGWFVIDNLPAALIAKVGELATGSGGAYDRVALVLSGHSAETEASIETLRSMVGELRIVFLEANTDVLTRRYVTSKRRHPLSASAHESGLVQAIEEERRGLTTALASADLVIDTSDLNPYQLRDRLAAEFAEEVETEKMRITVSSFGFKHGMPLDVDMVFDVRFLPNPYWDDSLRSYSGKDPEIQTYVLESERSSRFLDKLLALIEELLPAYAEEGKSYLGIAFGCTGGRHRSVAVAETVAQQLKELGWQPRVTHRDIDR
ncbi:MAG: RNase adapter RapZ [Acidimicrobiales bacterium]